MSTHLSLLAAVVLALCSAQAHAQYSYSRSSSFTYQANGLLASETVEPGNAALCVATSYVYDAYGNKVSATTANCAGAPALAAFKARVAQSGFAQHSFNLNGAPYAVPAGAFATSGKVALTANIQDPQSHQETRLYDPRFGGAVSLTGPNGLTTTWQLDDFGRPALETRADGTRSATYHCWLAVLVEGVPLDISSNSARCHNAGGANPIPAPMAGEAPAAAVRYEHAEPQAGNEAKIGAFARVYFDAAGRKIRTVTEAFDGPNQPGGGGRLIVQDSSYNAFGALLHQSQPYFLDSGSSNATGNAPHGASATVYDALGRPVELYTTDSTGNVASYSFGPHGTRRAAKTSISYAGLNTTTTDDLGRTRTEEKNPDGKVVRITDAMGAQLVHQHDAFGNLVATKDALQNLTTIAYDVRGRKLNLDDPDSGVTAYCYDALGQLKAQQTSQMRGGHTPAACPSFDGAADQAAVVATWTTMAHDRLGRMTHRVEAEYQSFWDFDTYNGGGACAMGKGKLCQSRTSNGLSRKAYYDNLGRPLSSVLEVTGTDSITAASAVSYDSNGRLASQTYPTGVKVSYGYTARGFVADLKLDTTLNISPLAAPPDGATSGAATLNAGSVLWSAGALNAWGRAESSAHGSTINNRASFDPDSGRLLTLTAGKLQASDVVDQRLAWNSVGQLTQRIDAIGAAAGSVQVLDTFVYDPIGRLTQTGVSGGTPGTPVARSVTVQYNALGMLLGNSEVGNLSYGAQGAGNRLVHAASSVVGPHYTVSYTYNLEGSRTSGGLQSSVTYTSFNQVGGLSKPSQNPFGGSPAVYSWQYDEAHQRVKETRVTGQGANNRRVTWYLHPDNQGGLGFERDITGAISNNRHYLSVGGMAVGVLITRGALPTLGAQTAPTPLASINAVKLEYWHKDHLGSLIATSDHGGAVTARYAYDAFGKRREVNSSYDAFGSIVVDFSNSSNRGTDRGYTGHEHLDDVGLVNMNGRMYDPVLGRFLQADPFVQDPGNLQSFDRYAYCFNAPTSCTDPSGYVFKWIAEKWREEVWRSPTGRAALSIVVAYFTYGAANGYLVAAEVGVTAAGYGAAAVSGFAAGAVNGGSLKAGLQGAFSAVLFAGVGDYLTGTGVFEGTVGPGEWSAQGVALHGVAGCVSSVAAGGKCGPAALSAAFSQAALPLKGKGLQGLLASAVIGGTASALGGGKFANGAFTAGFGYLFNCLAHGCNMKSEGYEPTKYPNGTVCNATSTACTAGTGTDAEVGKGAVALFVGSAAVAAAPFAGGWIWTAGLDGGANSIFWAGPGTQAVANGLGGITISQTPVGSVLAFLDGFGLVSRATWVSASATFASNAQGIARAVLNSPWPTTIWVQTESQILAARNVLVNVISVVPK